MQSKLTSWTATDMDLSALTEAEKEVYLEVEEGSHGPRSYARETDRSPGTIGNLLARAREKLEGPA